MKLLVSEVFAESEINDLIYNMQKMNNEDRFTYAKSKIREFGVNEQVQDLASQLVKAANASVRYEDKPCFEPHVSIIGADWDAAIAELSNIHSLNVSSDTLLSGYRRQMAYTTIQLVEDAMIIYSLIRGEVPINDDTEYFRQQVCASL